VSVADDVRQQITKRLKQLKPLVEEYHQLEGMLRKLASGDGAASSPGRSSTRARSRRRTNGRRRGRPRGSGTRSAQALALVEAKPGITIPEMAKQMGITPNYLYRVLPELAKDGKVKKNGNVGARFLDPTRRASPPVQRAPAGKPSAASTPATPLTRW
jgi:hypothetical protein